jgi:hypothetical protein
MINIVATIKEDHRFGTCSRFDDREGSGSFVTTVARVGRIVECLESGISSCEVRFRIVRRTTTACIPQPQHALDTSRMVV